MVFSGKYRKYLDSFCKYAKSGCSEISENNLHYPLCSAASLTFLDTFTTMLGESRGILREANPLHLYIRGSLSVTDAESMVIAAAMGAGIMVAGVLTDRLYHASSKNAETDRLSVAFNCIGKKLYEKEKYPATKAACILRSASAAVGFASGIYHFL